MLSMLCCVCETHYHIRFWINKAGGQSHVRSSLPNAEGCIHHWYDPAHTCNLNGDFQFHDGDRLSLELEQSPQLISSETIRTCLDRISRRDPQGIDYFNVLKFHSEYSLFQQCLCVSVCVLVSTLSLLIVSHISCCLSALKCHSPPQCTQCTQNIKSQELCSSVTAV